MVNHLEQLISEWLEHDDYFVRRNVKVGRSPTADSKGKSISRRITP